jgi:hypothetical protein
MVVGEHRSFEWFWAASGEMPGLDEFKSLDKRDQDAIIATFEYWSSVPIGKRAIETRVNEEHHDPLILAGKSESIALPCSMLRETSGSCTGAMRSEGASSTKLGASS